MARTHLLIDCEEADKQLSERIREGNLLIKTLPTGSGALAAVKLRYLTWDEYNATLLQQLFSTEEIAREYKVDVPFTMGKIDLGESVRRFVRDVSGAIRRLESVRGRLKLFAQNGAGVVAERAMDLNSRKVFIVHGRNEQMRESVARLLQMWNLQPVILNEQANAGSTLIEKFERNADARFAVVLLTPDDVGCLQPGETSTLRPRARQNVIFEWGYFVALLSRRHVCALVAEGVELPSDMEGIGRLPIDNSGAWKTLLGRELRAVGIEVDLNKTA